MTTTFRSNAEALRRHLNGARAALGSLADVLDKIEAETKQVVEENAQLREDLDKIKRLAYMGGQDAETVRRMILGVFEKRSRS